ncbi:uncharacterized protein LOC101855715 [Aplysia californica]|uniref:Uncharacterized protein LOC101855715 n=1 Tax=Aplysia californica TaxID=6500 RepID=A0ABM0JJT3_APLCA|nr:uncharacterized protein LOC101855715 [Aplysia californica]
MEFVGMKSIKKNPSIDMDDKCTDWVATEKVHGSSYQFYTSDGNTVIAGSRRYPLEDKGSFLKCNTAEFKERYVECVKKVFQIISSDERWEEYKEWGKKEDNDDDDAEENVEEEAAGDEERDDEENSETVDNPTKSDCESSELKNKSNDIELRIYGELYGGGGVELEFMYAAIQKEIIYSDEYRFYVFGINVNRNWLSVVQLGDLCREVGFPYFAVPVTEPKATLEELKDWLKDTGFMNSRSSLTERTDDYKTNIEGVVMTPLTRPDFGLHAVKYLSTAFVDVKQRKDKAPNYCTKARYNSVLSKLDIPERQQTDMVIEMFIADILKESGAKESSNNETKSWTKSVRMWLMQDGYLEPTNKFEVAMVEKVRQGKPSRKDRELANLKMRESKAQEKEVDVEEDDDDEDDDALMDGVMGLFGD